MIEAAVNDEAATTRGRMDTLAAMADQPDKLADPQPSRIEDLAADSPTDERVERLLQYSIDVPVLAEAVGMQEPADAADTLEQLEEEQAADVLEEMDDEAAADVLSEMNRPLAVSILDDLIDQEIAYAALLLEQMAPDDAADILQALDAERRARLLSQVDPDLARKLSQLMRYGEETAGGLMTTEFLALRDGMTVAQAIEHIRGSPVPEHQHSALVTDSRGLLVGVVPLRKLLLARPTETIGSIMERSVDFVRAAVDREEVAHHFDRYDYDMLPVVDDANRLLGIVTVDDVIDIIRAEQTEDVQMMVGAGAFEAVYSPVSEKLRGRFPWLGVGLVTTGLAAVVVLQFEQMIARVPMLAVCMPVVAAVAGNTGNQALAVTIRGIVLDEVRRDRVWPLILREGIVGLMNGLLLGLAIFLILSLLGEMSSLGGWKLGVLAGSATAVSMAIGGVAGCGIPLLMRRVGIDPAAASSIFLIMITDAVSFYTLLGSAAWFIGWLQSGTG